jgi:hypothetical protein
MSTFKDDAALARVTLIRLWVAAAPPSAAAACRNARLVFIK